MKHITTWWSNRDLIEMYNDSRLHHDDYTELMETRSTVKINILGAAAIVVMILATAAHSYVS